MTKISKKAQINFYYIWISAPTYFKNVNSKNLYIIELYSQNL